MITKKHTTKGQLQSMETIIVVILLMILLLFGSKFYAGITQDTFETLKEQQSFASLEKLWLQLSYLPELSCPRSSTQLSSCIDAIKLTLLSERLTNAENSALYLEYYALFGDSRITFTQVYPSQESILLFDAIVDDYEVFARQLPVTLYDPFTDTTVLGLLFLEVSS